MAIPPLSKKPKRLMPTREEIERHLPASEVLKMPMFTSEKASNPRPQKLGNTQQKSQIKQGGNANLKSAKKNKTPLVSRSPYFEEKSYNVMTAQEQVAYLDELAHIPKYKTTKMTRLEAQDCIGKIKSKINSIMRLCYELATRKGYEVLGYKDFKECVMKELAGVIGYDYAHKMKNAGEVHVVVCPKLPMGTVPESVLRPMHRLSDDEMKEVWDSTVKEDVDGAPIIPTANDITSTIKAIGFADDIIDVKDLKRSLRDIEFSPKLKKHFKEDIEDLIEEYIKKSSITPTPPVSKEHFEKTVRILLNALRTTILGEYEKLYGRQQGNRPS